MIITEELSPMVSSLDERILPDEDAFKKLSSRYNTYTKCVKQGIHPLWICTPWGLANSIKDSYKKLRYFFTALLLGWDDLVEKLKEVLKADGYNKEAITNISDYVLRNKSRFEDLLDKYELVEWEEPLTEAFTEDIARHDTLNTKLFDTKENKLKDEVREKLIEITDAFVNELTQSDISIEIKDIVIIGSNVSYNYTKDSDLDLHIIADVDTATCPQEIYNALYSAYRSLFNKQFDIDFYGIPVEIYVEVGEVSTISNGIYSVLHDEWIKEPELQNVPEIDKEAFNKAFVEWEKAYKELKKKVDTDKLPDESEVVQFIEDVYDLRKTGLSSGGEYSTENLIFKELRNKGYLDDCKDMRNELISKRLSLEEAEALKNKNLIISKLKESFGKQITIDRKTNSFTFLGVNKNAVKPIMEKLDLISGIRAHTSGPRVEYDINQGNWSNPKQTYSIFGKIL